MPSTDLTSQKWDLRGSLNLNKFTKGGKIQVPGTYQNPLLRVEIRLRGLKATWNQLGYLHQTHAGATHPKGHYLSVHDQLLQLANLAPYKIFIQLVPWAIREAQSGRLSGSLRFYESGTTLKPADLSNLDSFHRQQMSLVNPISINFPPEMDNSTKFTRSIAVNLVAGVSSVLAPVNDNRTGAVLRNPGAFDVYLCLADVATAASAIAVLEPNGFYELAPSDYNGAISVICPAGAGSIAGSEMASTAFVGMPSEWVALSNSGRSVALLNGSLMVSQVGNQIVDFDALRDTVGGPISGILEAVVMPTGTFGVKTANGYYYASVDNWVATAYDMATYEAAKTQPGAIVL